MWSGDPVDPSDPFSETFKITNIGTGPLYDVSVRNCIGKIEAERLGFNPSNNFALPCGGIQDLACLHHTSKMDERFTLTTDRQRWKRGTRVT
jgi:hypothetical protein